MMMSYFPSYESDLNQQQSDTSLRQVYGFRDRDFLRRTARHGTMNTLTVCDPSVPSPDTDNNIEQAETEVTKMLTESLNVPNVLDPDDSLMKKFQNALREHLIRVDNKLNSEILELVSIRILNFLDSSLSNA